MTTEAILGGVLTSFIGTIIYLFYRLLMKPKLVLSPIILKGRDSKGVYVYKIKIINKGFFPVSNIKAQLHKVVVIRNGDREEIESSPLKLKQNEVFVLNSCKKSKNTKEGPKHNYCSFTFFIYNDIEQFLNNTKHQETDYLRFRVYGINDFSGVGAVFTKFYSLNNLKEGEFIHRENFVHSY